MTQDGPIFEKFKVTRTDGRDACNEKHYGCAYFVLDLTHDPHAAQALRAYAASCRKSHPVLSAELIEVACDIEDRRDNISGAEPEREEAT